MRIVIVGATGNIGTALLRRLAAEPGLDVVGVARRLPDADAEPYSTAEWHAVDVGDDSAPAELRSLFAGADAVVHLAWALQPNRDERVMARTNVRGTRHVLDAAGAAGVPQLLVASSVASYSVGPKRRRVGEDWPTGGIHTSHYSRHKAANERAMDAFETRFPAATLTRIRPGLVFQGDAATEIAGLFAGRYPMWLLALLRLPVLPLPSSVISQAVHARDVADAFWRAIERRAGGAFNIAAEPVLTPQRVADAAGIGRHLPVRYPVARGFTDVTWRLRLHATDPGWIDIAVSVPVMSTARAREVLGWTETVSSTDALREILDGVEEGRRVHASGPLSGDGLAQG